MEKYTKYYVNIEIRTGGVIGKGDINTGIYKKPLHEFIKYLQNIAMFKVCSRYILNNMNYISMIYLSLDYEDHLQIKNPDNSKPLFKGDLKWLNENYPTIHRRLMDNKQVVVCYMLAYEGINNNKGYHTVDILESRIHRNGLATIMLSEYERIMNVKAIPFGILYDAYKFWLSTPLFKDCFTGEDLKNAFMKGFKESSFKDIYETNEFLFEILGK